MDPNNRQGDDHQEEGNDPASSSETQEQGTGLFQQTPQQPQTEQQDQFDQFRHSIQSTDPSTLMQAHTTITGQQLVPGMLPMNPVASTTTAPLSAAAAPPMPANMLMPQDMMALMGAQENIARQQAANLNTLNPIYLQQIHAQQQQQQQMQSVEQQQQQQQQIMQAQHSLFNQQLLGLGMQPHQHSTGLQQDPLLLGNMLHQTRGPQAAGAQQIPPEAQSLFTSHQFFTRMAQMNNPLGGMGMGPRPPKKIIDPEEELKAAASRGIIEPFPEKLHRLLMEAEQNGQQEIISWTGDGKSFEIHKPDRFFKEIVPKYFKQSRLSSFKRQLNLYGFELIAAGPARGGYSHENFLKDKPDLCRQIRRRDIKFNSRPKSNKWEINAPDFYNMPPITTSDNAKEPGSAKSDNTPPNEEDTQAATNETSST